MASAAVGQAVTGLEALGEALQSLTQSLGTVIDAFNKNMKAFGNSILSFAQAGLQGTTEGARMTVMWQHLSREIASAFLPAIHSLINGLQKVIQWFQSLTGEGQHMVMMVGGVATAFAALGPIVGKMLGALSPTAIALGLFIEGLMQFFTGTTEGQMVLKGLSDLFSWFSEKMGGFAGVFRTVADAVVVMFQGIVRGITFLGIKIASVIESIMDWVPGLGDAVEAIRKWRENAQINLDKQMASGWGLQNAGKPVEKQQVNRTGFNFESLSASFERITAEANKKDLATETLNVQKQQLEKQAETIRAVNKVEERLAEKPASPRGDH